MGHRVLAAAATCAALSLVGAAAVSAETSIEREMPLEQGGRFVLDTDTGSVEVVGVSGSGVRVRITSSRDDFESMYDVRFEERPGEVVLRVDRKNKLSGWFKSSGSARFHVELPERTEIDIDTAGGSIDAENVAAPARLDTSGGSIRAVRIGGELSADTSGGSIRIEDVDGDVVADTSGGSITVRGVRGDVVADTSGGGITVEDATGDVEADTSGGSVTIAEAGGRVKASSSGGPIRVSFAPGNSSGGSVSTSGGGIKVELDPGVGLDIDAHSSGGSVDFDLPMTVEGSVSRSVLKGKLGAGGETLKLRTSGGGIEIKAR